MVFVPKPQGRQVQGIRVQEAPTSGGSPRTIQALSRLGDQAMQTGFKVLADQKKAEDRHFAISKAREDRLALVDRANELQKQAVGGKVDNRPISQHLEEFAKERQKLSMESAPSGTAQTLYSERAQPKFDSLLLQAEQFEQSSAVQYRQSQTLAAANDLGNSMIENPDPFEFDKQWVDIKEEVMAGVGTDWSQSQADSILSKARQEAYEGLLGGLYNQDRLTEAAAIIGLNLKGKGVDISGEGQMLLASEGLDGLQLSMDQAGEIEFFAGSLPQGISEGTDSGRNQIWAQRILRGLERNAKMSLSKKSKEINDYKAALEKGAEFDPQLEGEIKEFLGPKNEKQWLRVQADFKMSHLVGDLYTQANEAPLSEMAGIVSSVDSIVDEQKRIAGSKGERDFLEKNRQKYKARLVSMIQKAQKERQEDFATHAIQGNDDLAQLNQRAAGMDGAAAGQLAREMEAKATAMQHIQLKGHQTLIPKDTLQMTNAAIKKADTETQVALFNSFYVDAGDMGPKILNQAIKDGSLPESYAAIYEAAINGTPDSQMDLIQAVKNVPRAETIKKDLLGENSKEFDTALDEKWREDYDAYLGSQGLSTSKKSVAFKALTEARALELMRTDGLGRDEAIDEAAKEVFDQNFMRVDDDNGSMLALPKSLVQNVINQQSVTEPELKSIMKYGRSRGFLEDLDLQMPSFDPGPEFGEGTNLPAFGVGGPIRGDFSKKTPEERIKNTYLRMIEQTGQWIYNPDAKALRLRFQDAAGKWNYVFKKDGEPLELDPLRVKNEEGFEKQKRLDRRSFFEKFVGTE